MALPGTGVHLLTTPDSTGGVTDNRSTTVAHKWPAYYRWTSKRPPRDLLLQVLNHVDWEGKSRGPRKAVEIGFGAGNDTLELIRRGWHVLAVDAEVSAAEFLARRVPPRGRSRLTTLVAPMEGLRFPRTDLVYASFSLPFCDPDRFPELWTNLRRAVRPGGHIAVVLFGDRDEWRGKRRFSFHSRRQIAGLSRGWNTEMLRETVEEGRSFEGPKHWHFFELILEKPGSRRVPLGHARRRKRARRAP